MNAINQKTQFFLLFFEQIDSEYSLSNFQNFSDFVIIILMKILQLFTKWFCMIGILISVFYTIRAGAIAFFIVTGTLTPGYTMFLDGNTQSLVKN